MEVVRLAVSRHYFVTVIRRFQVMMLRVSQTATRSATDRTSLRSSQLEFPEPKNPEN